MARMEWNFDEAKMAWFEEGEEKGRIEGRVDGVLTSLKNLIKNTDWSVERAMDVLQIHGDDRKKYAGLVNG